MTRTTPLAIALGLALLTSGALPVQADGGVSGTPALENGATQGAWAPGDNHRRMPGYVKSAAYNQAMDAVDCPYGRSFLASMRLRESGASTRRHTEHVNH